MANIMKNIHFLLWWLTFPCFYANTNTKAPSSSSRYAWEADLGLGDEGLASHTFGTKRLAHAADHSLNDWRQTMTLELTLTLYPSRLVWDVHIRYSLICVCLLHWIYDCLSTEPSFEGLYKFVIIGSHLALWNSPHKPAQTCYFLSNPLLSFHQPFYTSLSVHQHLHGYFLISACPTMLAMAWLWWCDGGGDGTFAVDLWFDTTADLCTLAPLCWGKQRQETTIFVNFLPQCSDDQLMRILWGKCSE